MSLPFPPFFQSLLIPWKREGDRGWVGALLYLTASNGMESWICLWWCVGLALVGALLYLAASNGMESWTGFWWCAGLALNGALGGNGK